MSDFQQNPIISAPNADDHYAFPGSMFYHRAKSVDTKGVFSVIELITEPGQSVAVHVHQHEDELVYVIDGQIEVTLGDQHMKAGAGIMALLPRGIPHGFTNIGDRPSRLLVRPDRQMLPFRLSHTCLAPRENRVDPKWCGRLPD